MVVEWIEVGWLGGGKRAELLCFWGKQEDPLHKNDCREMLYVPSS